MVHAEIRVRIIDDTVNDGLRKSIPGTRTIQISAISGRILFSLTASVTDSVWQTPATHESLYNSLIRAADYERREP